MFALVPLAVVFGAAEAGLRAAGWPPRPSGFEHNQVFWTLDPELKDKAFSHAEAGRTFQVSTDVSGLRPPFHDGPKAPGAWRVLALGCSTTLGWGVDDAETYPARLEARGRAAGYDAVEVINGGQMGYTTFQGRLWWPTVAAYQPDVVLLGYVVQDARKAAYTDRSQAILQDDARFLKDHVLWRSRAYLGLRALLGAVQIRAKERPQTDGAPDDDSGVYRVPVDEYEDNLAALVAEARGVGAAPVLFGYPLEHEGYTTAHRSALARVAERTGAPLFDPQPQMSQEASRRTLYFPEDRGHANADGNDLIAVWVLAFLEQERLLGR